MMRTFRIAICALALAGWVTISRPAVAQTSAEAAPSGESSAATITFLKIFKFSYPEYAQIKVREDGSGTWDIRQLDESPSPQPLQLGPALTHKIFELAETLHDFDGIQLEAHRRIANLGHKTFQFEKGGESHEVEFNYTLNDSANQLLAIFQGLERQELDLSDLERTMRYDHLGVNDVVVRVQSDIKKKLIPEPQSLLPELDQIAADTDLLDMARQRARAIAEKIRNGQ